jgi:hypothetical protein
MTKLSITSAAPLRQDRLNVPDSDSRRRWLLAAARFCLVAATSDTRTMGRALEVLAVDAAPQAEGNR